MKNSKSAFNAPDECSGDSFSFGRSRGTVGLYAPSPRLKAVGFTLQSLTQFFVPDLSFCYWDLSVSVSQVRNIIL